MARFISRRVLENGQAAGPSAPQLGEWAGLYPALSEYMVQIEWAAGEPRVPSTLLIFTEQGMWKCCFVDKDQGQMAFLTAGTPTQLLQLLNTQLQAGSVDWKPWVDWRKKKKN